MFKATTAAEQQQTANITGENKRKLPKWLMASGVIGLVGIAIFAGGVFLAGGLFSKETPFAKIKVEEITSAPRFRARFSLLTVNSLPMQGQA